MRTEFIDKLSEILVEMGLIKPEDMISIHRDFKLKEETSFEDYLLAESIVERPQLLEALSIYYNVPAVDVIGEFFEHHNIRLVPKNAMLKYNFIPYKREGDNLTIVTGNPNYPNLANIISNYISHNIIFNVGIPQDINDTIREYYDKPITYQPNSLEASPMERSQIDVHSTGQEIIQEDHNIEIPEEIEETIDDYESK